jgi:hypothetical protein
MARVIINLPMFADRSGVRSELLRLLTPPLAPPENSPAGGGGARSYVFFDPVDTTAAFALSTVNREISDHQLIGVRLLYVSRHERPACQLPP